MTPSEFMQEYIYQSNTHNFDNVAAHIADDAVYWFNDGSFQGRDEIRKAFISTWQTIQEEKYSIENVHYLAEDEKVAVCIYTFRWQGMVDGQLWQGEGRGTNVLTKTDDRWVVIHEHLSRMPPA